jgi:hypothetical protein
MGCSVISATSFFALVRASTRLAVTSAVVVRMADLLRVFQMNKIASMRMGVVVAAFDGKKEIRLYDAGTESRISRTR